MELEGSQCHTHTCSQTNGHLKSCVSLVPIFNHLEADQMEDINE